MRIEVRGGNLDRALKVLQRKLKEDGFFAEVRSRQAYEKPSERRNRLKRSAISRHRKANAERKAALN